MRLAMLRPYLRPAGLATINGALLVQPRIECELRLQPANSPSWVGNWQYEHTGGPPPTIMPPGDYYFVRMHPAPNGMEHRFDVGFGGMGALASFTGDDLRAAPDFGAYPWEDRDEPAIVRASYITTQLDGGAPRIREWDVSIAFADVFYNGMDRVAAVLARTEPYRLDWTSPHTVAPVAPAS